MSNPNTLTLSPLSVEELEDLYENDEMRCRALVNWTFKVALGLRTTKTLFHRAWDCNRPAAAIIKFDCPEHGAGHCGVCTRHLRAMHSNTHLSVCCPRCDQPVKWTVLG